MLQNVSVKHYYIEQTTKMITVSSVYGNTYRALTEVGLPISSIDFLKDDKLLVLIPC